MRTRPLLLAGLLAAALAAAGCGSSSSSGNAATHTAQAPPVKEASPAGDIPDNQAYVAYAPPGAGFSVKVPEGWARTSKGAAMIFTDKLNSIAMQTSARASTSTAGLQSAKVTTVSRTAGKATRISYLAQSAADPVTGKTHVDAVERYVFHHGSGDVVLTLSGPKGADNVDPWKIVTESLRFTR